MTTATRLVSFALGLAVIGAGAAAIGSATNATPPFQDRTRPAAHVKAGVSTPPPSRRSRQLAESHDDRTMR